MISEIHWVDAAKMKSLPINARDLEDSDSSLSEEEEEEVMDDVAIPEKATQSLRKQGDTNNNSADTSGFSKEDLDIMRKYGMEDYDNEDSILPQILTTNAMMSKLKLGQDVIEEVEDSEGELEDIEDMLIRKDDGIILAARSDEELSHLDVFIYEPQNNGNLYLHHDILLDSYPLCFSWIGVDPQNIQNNGSFVAVGVWDPHITIWNLDIINSLDPIAVLGGKTDNVYAQPINAKELAQSKKGKKKKKKVVVKDTFLPGSHTDSVLSLSWNPQTTNALASASADSTIKIWDISTQQCASTLQVHKDKVQTVEWHPQDSAVLISGGFDTNVTVLDVRSPQKAASWAHSGEVEKATFDIHNLNAFFVACEDGHVFYHDVRKADIPVWTLSAHSEAATSLAVNRALPGLIATGSCEKKIKLWSISNGPALIHTYDSPIPVLSLEFAAKYPSFLAAGGQGPSMGTNATPEDSLQIYDVSEVEALKQLFSRQ